MEEVILRFPHLGEQIFESLSNEDLIKCKEVGRSWLRFIEQRNYPWIRIIRIPTILPDGTTYLHVAAASQQIDMFEKIFDEEKEICPEDKNSALALLLFVHYKDQPDELNKFMERLDKEIQQKFKGFNRLLDKEMGK